MPDVNNVVKLEEQLVLEWYGQLEMETKAGKAKGKSKKSLSNLLQQPQTILTEHKTLKPKASHIMLPHLIGMSVPTAENFLSLVGWVLRVVRANGKDITCNTEPEYGRVSVSIWWDRIIGIEGVETPPEMEEIEMPKKGTGDEMVL